MKHLHQIVSFVILLLVVNSDGKTLIFPPAALPDLVKLGPARIETRWKPRSIPDGYFPTVEGYYVVYNHENLALFFGPVDTEPEAVKIQAELEKTRAFLISKNSSLSTSTVGRINIDFDGTPPTNQTAPPTEGLKPVRVLSGNSTLELGQQDETTDSTSGSSTEGEQSSTYGVGSGTEETGEPSHGTPNKPTSESEMEGSADSQPQPSGNSDASEETPSGNPLGKGILNVLSQGSPTGTEGGIEPSEGLAGQETESGKAAGSPQTSEDGSADPVQKNQPGSNESSGSGNSESTAPTDGGGTGGQDPSIPPVPIQPGQLDSTGTEADSGSIPPQQGGSGEEGEEPPTVTVPGAQEQLESIGTPSPPGSPTSSEDTLGEAGSEPGNPAEQSPPTPPAGPDAPLGQSGLPESAVSQAGNEAPESKDTGAPSTGQEVPDQPTGSQAKAATSDTANEQLNEAEESLNSTGETTESTESPDASSTEESGESSGEESPTKEEKEEPEPFSPETQTTEVEEETTEDSAEQAEQTEPVPPTPASLELGESTERSTAPASSISINQLLKRKLGQSIPPVPPAEPEQ